MYLGVARPKHRLSRGADAGEATHGSVKKSMWASGPRPRRRGDRMKRRDFIAGLGAAAVWPLSAVAQQQQRVRRIGVLTSYAAGDPAGSARIEAFRNALQQAGWTEGRNVQIDV